MLIEEVSIKLVTIQGRGATDRSSDRREWGLYDRATLGKIGPIVKKFKIRSFTWLKILGAVAVVHASLTQKAVVGAANNGMAKKCVMHLRRLSKNRIPARQRNRNGYKVVR
jgi:hypothetical protein